MLNDRSSILSLLETRRSAKPRELVGPGPTRAGDGAHPDHRRADARSWQALPLAVRHRGAATSATRLPCCSARRLPKQDPARRRRTRKRPMNSRITPANWSCCLRACAGHKIPLWEQELSCGAAAMNLLLAAHALGYVAGWVTGWRAYSRDVSGALSAGRASGLRALSSSASPAATSRSGLARRSATVWQRLAAAPELKFRLNFSRAAVL